MDTLQRNFFRLLRDGTFGDSESLEPISPWKWERLYQIAQMHGVGALVYDGLLHHKGDFFRQVPDSLWMKWQDTAAEISRNSQLTDDRVSELFSLFNKRQLRPILLKGQGFAQLYPIPEHRTSGDIDIFFPYEPQARKADEWAASSASAETDGDKPALTYNYKGIHVEHTRQPAELSNPLLNSRLQAITSRETRCCDSCYITVNGTKIECVPHTLNLLLMLVRITRYILNEGISLKQVTDLGMFLRKEGDRVDYGKLQSWLKSLHMQKVTQLIGALLVILFHFSEKELPFVSWKGKVDTKLVTDEAFRLCGAYSNEWYFTQGKDIFIKTSNSNAMLWQIRHCIKFFKYYPMEITTNFFTSFAHSLSHIEE